MSLIITRNFKRAKAQDAAAKDAKFKVGEKVRRGMQTGIVRGIEKAPYIEVKFTDEPVTVFVRESEIVAADSRAADADEFKVGTMVRFKAGEFKGKVFRIQEFHGDYARLISPVGNVSIPKHLLKDEVSVMDDSAACDAAEFRVGQRVRAKDPRWAGYQGHALGNGVYTVKKVDWDGTVKLNGFLDVWISPSSLVEANDACGNGKDRCGRDNCGKDGDSEYELGMKVLKAVGKVEDEIGAGVRRAKQLVNNVPDEDVRRRLNRKLDDIEKIADSFEDTII